MISSNRYILGEECEIIRALPGEDVGTVYMNPKDIEGQTLEKYVNENKILDTKTIYNISSSICDIIEHLYNLNLTMEYKDLKPSKIIMTPNNKIILVDIGLSKVHKVVENRYMAIQSIGKIIYYMTTGRLPFTILQPSTDANYKGNLDNDLKRIITKCFEVNIKNMYVSVEELNKEIIMELLKRSKYENEIIKDNHSVKLEMCRNKITKNNNFNVKKRAASTLMAITLTIEKFYENCKAILD